MNKKIAYGFIMVAAVLWGSIGLFTTKLASEGFTSLEMCFIRSFVSVLMIGGFFGIKDRSIFKLEKITDLKYFIGTGIISFSFFNWSYVRAIEETSLGVAAILLYTAPSIIMILSIFLFQEKITKKKVIILAITFVGCVLVTGIGGGSNQISMKGLGLGLCAGIGYALYSIFGKFALRKYQTITLVFYTFLTSTVLFLVITNPIQIVGKLQNNNMWIFSILFAILSAAIPYIVYTKGLSVIEASRASLIATLEPVVAAIFGIIVFGEASNPMKIIGMILVVGAVGAMSI
ncbi:MAG: EamA family transporter [Eubacteriales bacterium]